MLGGRWAPSRRIERALEFASTAAGPPTIARRSRRRGGAEGIDASARSPPRRLSPPPAAGRQLSPADPASTGLVSKIAHRRRTALRRRAIPSLRCSETALRANWGSTARCSLCGAPLAIALALRGREGRRLVLPAENAARPRSSRDRLVALPRWGSCGLRPRSAPRHRPKTGQPPGHIGCPGRRARLASAGAARRRGGARDRWRGGHHLFGWGRRGRQDHAGAPAPLHPSATVSVGGARGPRIGSASCLASGLVRRRRSARRTTAHRPRFCWGGAPPILPGEVTSPPRFSLYSTICRSSGAMRWTLRSPQEAFPGDPGAPEVTLPRRFSWSPP